jgi:hypothetical protein
LKNATHAARSIEKSTCKRSRTFSTGVLHRALREIAAFEIAAPEMAVGPVKHADLVDAAYRRVGLSRAESAKLVEQRARLQPLCEDDPLRRRRPSPRAANRHRNFEADQGGQTSGLSVKALAL